MGIATSSSPEDGGNSCAGPLTAERFLSLGLVCRQKGRQGPSQGQWGPGVGDKEVLSLQWGHVMMDLPPRATASQIFLTVN